MAIYLDSNILFPWRTFTELDRVALSIVAGQTQQRILIPWLVAEEARANYSRSLQDAVDQLDAALADVNRLFNDGEPVWVEPQPAVDEHVAHWQERLEALAQVMPVHADDTVEALRREVWGIGPARRTRKTGDGGRDAAIWLAVVRDHIARDEEGHFISKDRHFFEDGHLKPPMDKDLGAARTLRLYDGISEFLSVLGSSEEAHVEAAELALAVRSVKVVLDVASHVPRAVLDPWDERQRFRTSVKEATPVSVLAARRYARGNEALIVVDSEWDIVADLYHQDRDTDEPTAWWHHEDVHLHGTIQMYLPSPASPDALPQIVDARLKSDVTAYIHGDTVITFGPAEPRLGS